MDSVMKRISTINKYLLMIVTGVFLVAGNAASFNNAEVRGLTYSFLIALIGSAFLILVGMNLRDARWLSYLGKQTLPIYVLQGFAIAATRIVLTRIGFNDPIGLAPMLVCTITGVLLPLFAYWLTTKLWKLEALFYPGKYIKF